MLENTERKIRMSRIFLSMPILGKPCLQSIYSMYQAILSCKEHQVRVYFNQNDSLVQRVRNCHISAFLFDFPECDFFMSLDSDIFVINAYSTNNIFSKLIAHDKDFVGGLYSLKKPGVRRCSSITKDGTVPQFDTGLIEMRWLSSGCHCIKRSVIEKMYERYKDELLYDGDDNFSGKKVLGIYNCMLYDLKEGDFPNVKLPFKKLLSEDWSMTQRWIDIGGQIWADTSIVLRHVGEFEYSLWDVDVIKAPQTPKSNLPSAGFDLNKGDSHGTSK